MTAILVFLSHLIRPALYITIMAPNIIKVSKAAKIPIPGMSNKTSKYQVTPPITNPSNAAYVHIKTGFVDCENTTMSTITVTHTRWTRLTTMGEGVTKRLSKDPTLLISMRSTAATTGKDHDSSNNTSGNYNYSKYIKYNSYDNLQQL